MRHLLLYALCLMASLQVQAQHFEFDLTQAQPRYTDATGFGYDVVASPTKGSSGTSPFRGLNRSATARGRSRLLR